MNKKISIGIVCIVMASIVGIVAAQQNTNAATSSNSNLGLPLDSIGTVCFKYDSFVDTWHLGLEKVGQSFQISGIDPGEANAVISGGGQISGTTLLLEFDERGPFYSPSGNGLHSVSIDLTKKPLTGIDYVAFFNFDGVEQANYPGGLTFTQIVCPPLGALTPAGPIASKK